MELVQKRQRRCVRRWEAALMAGLAIALLTGVWLDREQTALAQQVVRLHVIANSDSDATMDFLNFEGTPTFNSTATLSFYGADEDSFIYEIKNGKLVKSDAEWSEDNGAWELKTRTLGSYVISDKALKSPSGSTSDNGGSNSGSGSGSNGSVSNPDTGANDVVGLAAALAAAALVSAAAVSLKKK